MHCDLTKSDLDEALLWEREKKFTISRRDAEAQRFEINKCSIFFVDSAPLRLCARYFCSFRNSFTASGRQGHVKVVEGKGEKNGRPVEEKQKPRPAACAAQPPAGQRMTGG